MILEIGFLGGVLAFLTYPSIGKARIATIATAEIFLIVVLMCFEFLIFILNSFR